ncbi:MAG: carbohydrate binding family 9 domain-containing protein, partial [Gemmatimonadetes bacterium]|nr:carbohydrate binding family 9 domain-containing protein [Gemmatimonadota bacterium]
MLPLLLSLSLLQTPPQNPSTSPVEIPRVPDAQVAIDGVLDEAVWQRAAVLEGFYQYLPVDDRPASDSTSVLVWYSPTDIYFGIRAYQDSASVRATLADRDKIHGDDNIQILLDTFNDQRQALLFAVNPLGVQADGTVQDAARRQASYVSSQLTGAYSIDLSQDYLFESRGRVTAHGYEVEVRIPFKTLRYQDSETQDWGLNIMRQVQASGHQHTWTRVLQSNPSFLSQEGILAGLTDLQRGLVLDLNPEMTSSLRGEPGATDWDYSGGSPEVGMNVRWGITNNLTLNGTANPDFSQVEADVAQIAHDPRQTLYYPEKRPFFLDGLEMFQSPTSLIYTRRLTDPIGAAKVTGKVSGTNVAILSGVDHEDQSLTGAENP